jgi:hypothetical protein
MRLEQKLVGESARQSAEMLPPFGPGFERRIVQQVESLQLMISDFNDLGPDFCEWRAFDRMGENIGTMRIRGY